jgi:hypothetical protein
MTYDYQGSLAQKLVDELMEVVYRYEEAMLLPTALGCLDLAKLQLLQEHMEDDDDDV